MSIVYDGDGKEIRHTDKSIDELKRESYHHKSIDGETEVCIQKITDKVTEKITLSLFDSFVDCLGASVDIKDIQKELNTIRDFIILHDLT